MPQEKEANAYSGKSPDYISRFVIPDDNTDLTKCVIVPGKEIRDYQESVFMGLSLRQFLFSLLAIGVAVGVYFGLQGVLGAETVSWLCVIAAFPFAILGFVKYHGMTAEQFIKVYIQSELTNHAVCTIRLKSVECSDNRTVKCCDIFFRF